MDFLSNIQISNVRSLKQTNEEFDLWEDNYNFIEFCNIRKEKIPKCVLIDSDSENDELDIENISDHEELQCESLRKSLDSSLLNDENKYFTQNEFQLEQFLKYLNNSDEECFNDEEKSIKDYQEDFVKNDKTVYRVVESYDDDDDIFTKKCENNFTKTVTISNKTNLTGTKFDMSNNESPSSQTISNLLKLNEKQNHDDYFNFDKNTELSHSNNLYKNFNLLHELECDFEGFTSDSSSYNEVLSKQKNWIKINNYEEQHKFNGQNLSSDSNSKLFNIIEGRKVFTINSQKNGEIFKYLDDKLNSQPHCENNEYLYSSNDKLHSQSHYENNEYLYSSNDKLHSQPHCENNNADLKYNNYYFKHRIILEEKTDRSEWTVSSENSNLAKEKIIIKLKKKKTNSGNLKNKNYSGNLKNKDYLRNYRYDKRHNKNELRNYRHNKRYNLYKNDKNQLQHLDFGNGELVRTNYSNYDDSETTEVVGEYDSNESLPECDVAEINKLLPECDSNKNCESLPKINDFQSLNFNISKNIENSTSNKADHINQVKLSKYPKVCLTRCDDKILKYNKLKCKSSKNVKKIINDTDNLNKENDNFLNKHNILQSNFIKNETTFLYKSHKKFRPNILGKNNNKPTLGKNKSILDIITNNNLIDISWPTLKKELISVSSFKKELIKLHNKFPLSLGTELYGKNNEIDFRKRVGFNKYILLFYNNKQLFSYAYGKISLNNFVCLFCEQQFNEKSLLIHIKTHVNEDNFLCLKCNYSCSNLHRLRLHCFNCYNPEIQKITNFVKEITNPLAKLKCKFCYHEFTHIIDLELHEKFHSGNLEYTCDACDAFFFDEDALKSHENIHHKLYLPMTCIFCSGDVFTPNEKIRNLFCCPICYRNFQDLNSFINHSIKIHGLKYFSCIDCFLALNIQRNLFKVLKNKNWSCLLCNEYSQKFNKNSAKFHLATVHSIVVDETNKKLPEDKFNVAFLQNILKAQNSVRLVDNVQYNAMENTQQDKCDFDPMENDQLNKYTFLENKNSAVKNTQEDKYEVDQVENAQQNQDSAMGKKYSLKDNCGNGISHSYDFFVHLNKCNNIDFDKLYKNSLH